MGLQKAAMHSINETTRSICFWQAKPPPLLVMGQLLTSSIDIDWSDVFPVT